MSSNHIDPEMALRRVAASDPLLVALDFDGTLAPFADEPMDARMIPAAREALDALLAAPRTIVALVSGRCMSDLRIIAEHDDDSRVLLAGSHGAEFWVPGEGLIEPADAADESALRDLLRTHAETATSDLAGRVDRAEDVRLRRPHPQSGCRDRRRGEHQDRRPHRRRGAALAAAHRVTTSSSTPSGTRARTPPSRR